MTNRSYIDRRVRALSVQCAAAVAGLMLVWSAGSQLVRAHEMTVQGTVAAIEGTRIQIKTGQEKSGQAAAWFPIDQSTRIRRGNKTVKLEDAHIKLDERVVAIVDHPDKGPLKTKEIRLAASK